MMTILPVIVVALLSNAFRSMLDTVHQVEEFRVGYRISEDNIGHDLLPQLKSVCEENGVLLQEYPQEDISLLMQGKTIAAFVEITDHSYTIYQSSDGKIEASIVENIFSSFFYDINSKMTEMTYVMEQGGAGVNEADSVQAVSEKLDTDPVPPSDDYYGIVFSVYSVWWGMLVLAAGNRGVLRARRVAHEPVKNEGGHE
jgi:ABC-2 type transport system permease protein